MKIALLIDLNALPLPVLTSTATPEAVNPSIPSCDPDQIQTTETEVSSPLKLKLGLEVEEPVTESCNGDSQLSFPLQDESEDIPGHSDSLLQEQEPSTLELNLKWLKQFILEQLTQHATVKKEFDPIDLQWTYKFFDSSQPTESHSGKRFLPFNIEAFETFEKDLEREFYSLLSAGKSDPDANRLEHLSRAIKNITSDVTWADSFTPNRNRRGSSSSSARGPPSATKSRPIVEKSNKSQSKFIFAFIRVPRDSDELFTFAGDISTMSSSQTFLNNLLPKPFHAELHKKHQIRVNFFDMWYFHKDLGLAANSTWKPGSPYAKPIPNVLHHLSGGKVFPITKRKEEPALPYWLDFLKTHLKGATASSSTVIPPFPIPQKLASSFEPKPKYLQYPKPLPIEANRSRSIFSSDISLNGIELDNEVGDDDMHVSVSARKPRRHERDRGYFQRSDYEQGIRANSFKPVKSFELVPYNGGGQIGRRNGFGPQRHSTPNEIMAQSHPSLLNKRVSASPYDSSRKINKNDCVVSRAELEKMQRKCERDEALRKALAIPAPARRPTPKKPIRRNLFSNSRAEQKDIESLIALASTSTFTRSPSLNKFQSPSHRNFSQPIPLGPRSPYCTASEERRLKVLRSKRRLLLGDEENDTYPDIQSLIDAESFVPESPDMKFELSSVNVICPESPATPPTKKTKRSISNLASSEKKVVQESPELTTRYQTRSASKHIRSTSFYSVSSDDSLKSKAWEMSGIKLKAAKLKESVEMAKILNSPSTASTTSTASAELID